MSAAHASVARGRHEPPLRGVAPFRLSVPVEAARIEPFARGFWTERLAPERLSTFDRDLLHT